MFLLAFCNNISLPPFVLHFLILILCLFNQNYKTIDSPYNSKQKILTMHLFSFFYNDWENANLVYRENNNVQENNDIQRVQENENKEERKVKPWLQWKKCWYDYFFI